MYSKPENQVSTSYYKPANDPVSQVYYKPVIEPVLTSYNSQPAATDSGTEKIFCTCQFSLRL